MRRSSIAAVLATAVGIAASDARAQQWLSDRTLTQGRGIRVGNFELHPAVGAEFGFDSNALYQATADSALRLRVAGSFGISTLGQQRLQSSAEATNGARQMVRFAANVGVAYSHFFGLGVPTSVRAVSDASNLGFNAGLSLSVTPSNVFSFSFADNFSRAVQGTSELNFGQLFVFNRWQNVGALGFTVTPGGGSFEFKLNYTNTLFVFFEPGFEGYSNMANDINVQMRWRFLPKTSISFSGGATPSFFFNPSSIGSNLSTGVPVNARLGVTGLITEKIAFSIFGGYGATYYLSGDNAETFVGNAEVRFITGPNMSVRAGVLRDIIPSYIGNYMIRNNLFVNVSHSFAGRFLLSGEASAGVVQLGYFSGPGGAPSTSITGPAVDPNTGRLLGFRALAQLFGEYRFTDYLGLNTTLAFTGNFVDAQLTSMGMTTGRLNWIKFEAFLGLRVNW
ncbi:MAG: hypothetical protein JNK05_04270 [Myxococcales bacterium]|nr:hypothetical protein [Myxococcales bacterium]